MNTEFKSKERVSANGSIALSRVYSLWDSVRVRGNRFKGIILLSSIREGCSDFRYGFLFLKGRYKMPTIDLTATGINIGALMKKNGISAAEVADRMGFSTRNAVYKWLKGESLPTLDNILILADLLDVSVEEILVVTRR